jgi:PhnB protein
VDDVATALAAAQALGATVVTEPTDFYGDTFSRFVDPWRNLWWVYRHEDVPAPVHHEPKELTYIHKTLLTSLSDLAEK